MEHNHLQPYKSLTEAFRMDCQTLITRFELSYNTNFQNFCEIWRDMQFSLIFAYFPTETVLITFCKKALCISKQFLVNGMSVKERIGALYLLYGIYYKMPKNQNENLKIRVTLSDWNCLMELHSQVKKDEYLDANYILCKLVIDNAFIHCISDTEYGIEKQSCSNQEKPKLDVNLMPEIKDLAEPGGLLSTISKLSKTYEDKKNSLYDAEGDSGLQLYDSDVADSIIESIRRVQSESRIFAKSNANQTTRKTKMKSSLSTISSASSSNSDAQKSLKRIRNRKYIVLAKIGQGFAKGLHSDSEEEQADEDEMEET
ncbi:hypothetical protein DMN91_007321 [Ooceraea biroi]|uniref:snRNA-activating protein complex subunit n=1 Tax=Ooceraea biroi TaxID=2015173 RepID=A0A026WFK4_OOCBI|nr:snRNA-activating protein complex subunit 1 [Ooceraea biroi]EZA54703.1 snRNA-activating protein complex subunit [Ooceraea biroi]RLU20708.1 hypothetical protein DMN91_007321 [Ooceraea biroi]